MLAKIPASVWTPAYDADGKVRDGACVAELTGLLDLSAWPEGMRVIARKERPHPGAQLRLTDQIQIWCALVGLAAELTAWLQLLAFAEHNARRWEPKRALHNRGCSRGLNPPVSSSDLAM